MSLNRDRVKSAKLAQVLGWQRVGVLSGEDVRFDTTGKRAILVKGK